VHRRGPYQLGFGPALTPAVQRLMIANGAVFIAQQLVPGLTEAGAVSPAGFFGGRVWEPFTYMWLHAGLAHVFFNMFALWMFGPPLEAVWGSQRFLRFYLICGVGAGFLIVLWNLVTGQYYVPTLGASGAIYGVLAAFSLSWPDRTIMLLFPPMPVKAIWFIPILFLLQLALGGGGNTSHIGHLGGVLVAATLLRGELRRYFDFSSLRYRWHRWRMRRRLRAVRSDFERRRRPHDDDRPPTIH
jgi:membrane associated rhomboid family serine protease